MLQCTLQRGGNRSRASAHLHHPAFAVVPHHYPARVARQPPRRFRGNVRPFLQHRLPGLVGASQHVRIDVHHDLVPLPRRPGIELVMQRRLGQQGQRVRLLLGAGRHLRGRVGYLRS